MKRTFALFALFFLVTAGAEEVAIRMRVLVDLRKVNIRDGGDGVDQTQFGQSSVTLSSEFQNKVQAVVKANIAHFFRYQNSNQIDFNDHFEVENFVDNAYIKIDDIGSAPLAILVGKRDLILGLHDVTEAIPLPYTFWENYQLKYDVIALTFRIADTVELTVYEGEDGDRGDEYNEGPGQGDFDINEKSAGVLLRIERKLAPHTKALLAYNAQKNEHLGHDKPEQKLTTGIKFALDKKTSAWVEGMHLFENPPLGKRIGDRGSWGVSTGLSYDLTDEISLVLSYTDIDKLTREYGLGLFIPTFFLPRHSPLREQSQLRFQIYHSEYPHLPWHEDTFVGLNWRWIFEGQLAPR